jgi:hypothetical protein
MPSNSETAADLIRQALASLDAEIAELQQTRTQLAALITPSAAAPRKPRKAAARSAKKTNAEPAPEPPAPAATKAKPKAKAKAKAKAKPKPAKTKKARSRKAAPTPAEPAAESAAEPSA